MGKKMGYNKRLSLWLALAAGLTLAFCLGAAWRVAAEAGELGAQVAQVQAAVAAEDWPRAELGLANAQAGWGRRRRIWLGLMNHQDVSNIDLAFAGAAVYTRERQRADALAQLGQLSYFLELAVESDRVCWHNLF